MTKTNSAGQKLWFRAKLYGWGWQPTSWEGWVIVLLYAAAIVQFGIQANNAHSASDALLNFSVPFVVTTIFLLIICYIRGERPRWRWGK